MLIWRRHLTLSLSLVLVILATLTIDATFYEINSLQSLSRFKRQAPNTNQAVPNQGPTVTTDTNNQDGPSSSNVNSEDKAPEETLTSFKCDFGSSESPDLCKFKIIPDEEEPQNKGSTSWSLGSGKLALYQGGPLIDASDRNDTLGGYIFYETSGSYTTNHSNHLNGRIQNQQQHWQPTYDPRQKRVIPTDPMQFQTSNYNSRSANQIAISHITNNVVEPKFVSPNISASGPYGMCLSFYYAIKGLSADELKVGVIDLKTDRSRTIWASSESASGNWTRAEILYSSPNQHAIGFSASRFGSNSSPVGFGHDQQQQQKFRGYLAVDEIDLSRPDTQGGEASACRGHCNFDGDLCGWTNAESGVDDDFDWTFGRGSDNLFTGPARDYASTSNNELTGSFLQIESSYPRRPGDRATLLSPIFPSTPVNDAMCMRAAVHMFGSGIGSLAIKIRYLDEGSSVADSQPPQPSGPSQASNPQGSQPPSASISRVESSIRVGQNGDSIVWEMSGDSGNHWHQAQTSISSSKSSFQIVIEGTVGENHLGNIAIDEISFSQGPCPTSPPTASKNYGDCTFEKSMCYWRNSGSDIRLDDLDWIRTTEEQTIHGPNFDHTLKKRSGSYLKLENTFREPKSGSRAFLLSPIFQPKSQASVQCLSFYYYMFMRSISSSGPNLGTIRVYLASNEELIPVWRLTNPISSPNWKHARVSLSTMMIDGTPVAPSRVYQIAFEGIWGDAAGGAIAIDDVTVFDGACDIKPVEAKSVPGECTFDVDLCSWSNKTVEMPSMGSDNNADGQSSPFIQYVNSATAYGSSYYNKQVPNRNNRLIRSNWQLATIDSRPVNLQDHTYKAPIGYVYIDVLDGGADKLSFQLQGSEMPVQSGQSMKQCLSFWYAAYGRQDTNMLQVHLTQASMSQNSEDDSSNRAPQPSQMPGRSATNQASLSPRSTPSLGPLMSNPSPASSGTDSSTSMSNPGSITNSNPQPGGSGQSEPSENSEDSNAWKSMNGKLIWNLALKNITEMNRRKWQYAQVTLRVDSNYIVRFVALSNDGGFALDDISFYDGACETRPMQAKVMSEGEDSDNSEVVNPVPRGR